MRFINLYFFIIISLSIISCGDDDGIDFNSDVQLSFSVDTVAFDTLFTGFSSTTKQLKIYNRSEKNIQISKISLADENSAFRLNINGVAGNEITDLYLASNDSLFIFAQVDLQDQNTDEARLLEDRILFQVNNKQQELVIDAWAQDVHLINEDIQNNQTWTGNRPYVVKNSISVNSGATLSIEEGTHIHFLKTTGLTINGNIAAEGSFENPILFSSTRLENIYDNVPGQWDGIYIQPESSNNIFSHFILKNGSVGISKLGNENVESQLKLEYGVIQNFVNNGISISNSDVLAHDLLINNCGEHCLLIEGGNQVEISHSTFFNSWFFSPRTDPTIRINLELDANFLMVNSIIYGSQTDELALDVSSNFSIENCLIRMSSAKQSDFSDLFADCIFNLDPQFMDIELNDFTIDDASPCLNAGNKIYGNLYPLDLMGNSRILDSAPDIGVYEFFEKE